jgi:hypothetical protein
MSDGQSRKPGWGVIGAVGKTLAALLPAGLVAALAGKGTLATILLAVGAVGGAVGVVAEARSKAVKDAEAERATEKEQARVDAARERAIASALAVEVCAVGDVDLRQVGVDPVDPRILEHAFMRGRGDQLQYVPRAVDACLRQHLVRARDGTGPTLVCINGPSKAGKSRTMFEAVRAELADAALVVPARTRENLQTVLDADVLQKAASENNGLVVLWLDDLEGFVRLGNDGLNGQSLNKLEQQLPALVVAATAGGRGLMMTQGDRGPSNLYEPLTELLSHGVRKDLLPGLTTQAERKALAAVVPPTLFHEMQAGLGAVAVSGERLVKMLVSGSHPRVDAGQPCREGQALTWAAIAAHRLGLTEPIPDEMLRKLFSCYANTASDEAFQRALRWGTEPLYGHVALLRSHDGASAPYDYLVQHAPTREDDAGRCAWQKLLDEVTAEDAFQLGVQAYQRGMLNDAAEAFRLSDERGGFQVAAAASLNFGVTLEALGRSEEAVAVYDEVIAGYGDATEPALREQVASALVNKGVTLGALGRSEEAVAVFDEVIARYGDATEPILRQAADMARTALSQRPLER